MAMDFSTITFAAFTSSTKVFKVLFETGASSAILASEGVVEWRHSGLTFRVDSYHVPQTTAHLLSPQAHLQHRRLEEVAVYSTTSTGLRASRRDGTSILNFPLDSSNLPSLQMLIADPLPPKAHSFE